MAGQQDVSLAFVAEANNGLELLEQVNLYHPDIVITDIKMPLMDGIQACYLIKKSSPSTKVIALSMFYDDASVLGMKNAGASGFLPKNAEQGEVLLAIKNVSKGLNHFPKENGIAMDIKEDNSQVSTKKLLQGDFSDIEIELIKLICTQLTNKEIAHSLGFSKRTVEEYRRKIQEKIQAKNAVGIVLFAIANAIVVVNKP